MSARIEFFFDYVSPYTYMADTQIRGVAERAGAELVYRPMLLGGLMQQTGNRPPATVQPKGPYMLRDLARWAKRYGVPFQMNPKFPLNTLTALRLAVAALVDGGFEAFHPLAFRAAWAEARDLGDPEVLRALLAEAGLPAERLFERAASAEVKDALKRNTEEAAARGAFGAPTFFIGDEMFFGNDRLDMVEEEAKRHR